jgi:hypothetical protein
MRKFLFAFALFASLCSTAIAGPKEDALQVLPPLGPAREIGPAPFLFSPRLLTGRICFYPDIP